MVCEADPLTPIYNTSIAEGVDNIKRFGIYENDEVTPVDITGATATFAMLSRDERKEYACTIETNAIVVTIPNTETFISSRYTHRLEMTLGGVISRVVCGTVCIEEDV